MENVALSGCAYSLENESLALSTFGHEALSFLWHKTLLQSI